MFEAHALPASDPPGERFVLYRPLAGLAFVGNRAMAEVTLAAARGEPVAGAAAAFLEGIGFLAPDPAPADPPAGSFRPATAVLLLTNDCQLRCRYCYADAGIGPIEVLEPALAEAVIRYVSAAAHERGLAGFELSLHGGGEPTRAWPVLRAAVALARAQPVPARITMTSNGVWSTAQTRWLLANVNAVTISVDGSPATQDAHRPFASGRGSSPVVLRTLAELDRARFPYALRITATEPWDRLPDDVAYLVDHTECRAIHVEPAFNTSRGGHPWPDPDAAHGFADAFGRAFAATLAAGRTLAYSGAAVDSLAGVHCSAPYDALIVTPRGDLVTCYEVTAPTHPLAGVSTIGRVVDGQVRIDDVRRQRLHLLLAQRRAACGDCFCRRTCVGDCYARGFGSGPQGHLALGGRCDLNRQATLLVLLALIARGGGVWRRGTPELRVTSATELGGGSHPLSGAPVEGAGRPA